MRAFFLSALVAIGSPACTGEPELEECSFDPGILCRIAGTGSAGANNAAELARESPLYSPMDVTVWKDAEDFFISDWNNHKIRHVRDGKVTTILGTDFLGDGDPSSRKEKLQGYTGLKWPSTTPPRWSGTRSRRGFSFQVGTITGFVNGTLKPDSLLWWQQTPTSTTAMGQIPGLPAMEDRQQMP